MYPWAIKVVRTITLFRTGSGYVFRHDSGWKAESDGCFDFNDFVYVPAELVTSSTADVGGEEATVLTSRNGLFAGVVWVEDGVMTGVAGSLSADELLSVARGLR